MSQPGTYVQPFDMAQPFCSRQLSQASCKLRHAAGTVSQPCKQFGACPHEKPLQIGPHGSIVPPLPVPVTLLVAVAVCGPLVTAKVPPAPTEMVVPTVVPFVASVVAPAPFVAELCAPPLPPAPG